MGGLGVRSQQSLSKELTSETKNDAREFQARGRALAKALSQNEFTMSKE